ncbi:DEKNAAC101892 [Brettanomyces naardenensis]|uniref:DEKNAAC101892 n=1 Tax=Brettanomyces naardenensis TaxID=13370 RepID=A0A448YJ40_BRENA|nr:DEKNAAC101892 [Brettanomyces naardenensis]
MGNLNSTILEGFVVPPPACATPVNAYSLPPIVRRARTHNYLNEVRAQNQASQDNLDKQEQRRLSERTSFKTMSPQIYKRRCSLSSDIPKEKLGYGYSGDNSTTDFSSGNEIAININNRVERHNYNTKLNDPFPPSSEDAGDESSVSASYSNLIAGQQGGATHLSSDFKERVDDLRHRFGELNQNYEFESEGYDEDTDEEEENLDPSEEAKRRRARAKRRTSGSFNEYKTNMLRKSLSSHDDESLRRKFRGE